jgi:hypothetical protein
VKGPGSSRERRAKTLLPVPQKFNTICRFCEKTKTVSINQKRVQKNKNAAGSEKMPGILHRDERLVALQDAGQFLAFFKPQKSGPWYTDSMKSGQEQ